MRLAPVGAPGASQGATPRSTRRGSLAQRVTASLERALEAVDAEGTVALALAAHPAAARLEMYSHSATS